ncbi:VanW family protein, partial [Candidatus Uhrbacteria bacterium]|nr:VanW family protein [Candidatus Uhrbacteria bacterium]
ENGELPHIALNTDTVRSYLESKVAPDISIAIQQQKYEIKHGKVTTFQHARDGQELDREQSINAIESALLNTVRTPAIELRSKQIPALPSDMDGETLVIKEIIGRGVTDFRGSPPNRRHNIATGMKQINGIIIKNGETFSLVSALGSIDDTGGYKPELVIKGTKTIPEYGGGLCQVSTTLFRAVAYAGLPIVERKNHSYRVSYYEPPIGFDATIYSPKPDFRFTNDTGYPILIQARVEGTKVSVDLWGVHDGRRVEVDEPTVFNIKKAPPVRYIETSDLKPGEKKCTERAHDGADAVFERRVYPVSGEMKKDIFKSHYVVWPAVCLVGEEQKEPQDIPAEKSDTDTVEQP